MLTDLFTNVNERLRGQPDYLITAALLAVAALTILVALAAPRIVKAMLLTWEVFP